ncbi:MAG: hypothetical protein BWY46_01688 [Firmicutes bacterium ADurb.Bin300]|nr:MAG: hypothetical protein BWY46_01688 [Firmicutes bacterium ADurb.Bin300]
MREVDTVINFDAFEGGVEYGGLRNKSEIRILVCYLLSRIEEPISKQQLADSLTGVGLVNYFEINEAVDALLALGAVETVTHNERQCLTVSENGREIASTLEEKLTKSIREKAVNAAMTLLLQARRERENKIETEKREGGYFVTFTMYGFSEEILKITLFAADSMQARMLEEGFLKDPVGLYSQTIDRLINNKDSSNKKEKP